MNGLIDVEATLAQDDERNIEAGLRGLADLGEYLESLLANGAGGKLTRVFENVAGGKDKLDALKRELASAGTEVAKDLDAVDKLLALAARVRAESPGPTVQPVSDVSDPFSVEVVRRRRWGRSGCAPPRPSKRETGEMRGAAAAWR